MKTFLKSLQQGFKLTPNFDEHIKTEIHGLETKAWTVPVGYWSFEFGDGYELCFEPLMFDHQYYVALYKDKQLLTDKVVVKPGYITPEDEKSEVFY